MRFIELLQLSEQINSDNFCYFWIRPQNVQNIYEVKQDFKWFMYYKQLYQTVC